MPSLIQDWVDLDLPTYPKNCRKAHGHVYNAQKVDYPNAQKFCDYLLEAHDSQLFRSTFNPQGTPVNTAGIELQRFFDSKWKVLSPLHEISQDEEDEEALSDDEHSHMFLLPTLVMMSDAYLGAIAALEDQ
ncbi:uncharacterized protein ARMOST_04747 [Armillaria ostoyae]|uniref:Uncharacterized protein n=1 Tax=Armillaria ostoyae TaxID=47428 RepID=A0A284QYD6_ARMOS|nr:uncharacterized protein ARMOST_04747 [Armillaria ostoyae]